MLRYVYLNKVLFIPCDTSRFPEPARLWLALPHRSGGGSTPFLPPSHRRSMPVARPKLAWRGWSWPSVCPGRTGFTHEDGFCPLRWEQGGWWSAPGAWDDDARRKNARREEREMRRRETQERWRGLSGILKTFILLFVSGGWGSSCAPRITVHVGRPRSLARIVQAGETQSHHHVITRFLKFVMFPVQ